MLAELGAVVIDADALAREVVAKGTPGLEAVVEEFGEELLGPDGELDRPAMGRLVFSDEQARRRLEAIVHPLVFERIVELERQAPADAVVVHDIPLLAENGRGGDFDAVIVVDAPARGAGRADDRPTAAGPRRTPGPGSRRRPRARTGARSRPTSSRTPGRAKTSAGGWRRSSRRWSRRGPERLSAQAGPARRAVGGPAQAARSGSARRRSLAIASRSSWRTRSAEMPWRAPMSASLCWRPSIEAVARAHDVGRALVEQVDQRVQPVARLGVEHGQVRARRALLGDQVAQRGVAVLVDRGVEADVVTSPGHQVEDPLDVHVELGGDLLGLRVTTQLALEGTAGRTRPG